MRRLVVFPLLLIAAAVSLAALDVRVISAGAAAERIVGYASYDLKSSDAGGTVYSRLEFPLDGWYVGARGGIVLVPQRGNPFVLDLWGLRSVTDPEGSVKDGDWIEPAGGPKLKFSYTESDSVAVTTLLGADLSRLVWITPVGKIRLGGGLRFHTTDQDVRGYQGWQVDLNPGPSSGDVIPLDGGDVLAATYRLTVVAAHALASLTGDPLPWMTASLHLFGGPAYIDDRDDHVLRYKLSTSSGVGIAGGARAGVSFHPFAGGRRIRPSFSLDGEVYRVYADLKQTQKWYDGSGLRISGIGHKVEVFNLSAGLALALEVLP